MNHQKGQKPAATLELLAKAATEVEQNNATDTSQLQYYGPNRTLLEQQVQIVQSQSQIPR